MKPYIIFWHCQATVIYQCGNNISFWQGGNWHWKGYPGTGWWAGHDWEILLWGKGLAAWPITLSLVLGKVTKV